MTGETEIRNAFSVDVEDYFQVGAFEKIISRAEWDRFELRVEANTERILELLERSGAKATFFVLGWVAERCPELVRTIADAGHEVGSHGYDHRRVVAMTQREFRTDVRRSKQILEDLTGLPVLGYRAPNFSITRETLWAMDVLAEEGYLYDSSVFPTRRRHQGVEEVQRFPWSVETSSGAILLEFPVSTVRIAGRNLPFVGGAYLRHFPMAWVRFGMRRVNRREGQPVLVYIHPWELDAEQPPQPVDWLTRIRHYRNLSETADRLAALLREFRFTTMKQILGLG